MENSNVKMKVYIGLGALQAFIGLGALGGGFMLVRDPSGSALGVPLSLLEGTPFPDFFNPRYIPFGCEWGWEYDWCWSFIYQKRIRSRNSDSPWCYSGRMDCDTGRHY